MRLFIAEKPSLARAIADALPGKIEKQDKLSITLTGGDIVCWAAGHILELPTPEEMNPSFKHWSLKTLPLIPSEWKLKPKQAARDLLGNIGRLLKQADTVINAGDADREGQLLIDEILEHFAYKGKVLRILVTDMNANAIEKALQEMRPNSEYKNLSLSAAARQRADWLLGINMTRLFTITTERQRGDIMSVGRVQTPTLALVVERDRQIENFISTPYYVIKAKSVIEKGEFIATWKPKDEQEGLNSEGQLIDKSIVYKLEKKFSCKIGRVIKFQKKETQTQQPLTYSLSALQIDASEKYAYSPEKTLQLLQGLYESKYVTYPRSDCGYLPETLYENRAAVLKTICSLSHEYNQYEFNTGIKTQTWNSSKTAEHHGIIPTGTLPVKMTKEQQDIYNLVAKRYAAQFLPAQIFAVVDLDFVIENESFSASTKQCVSQGWHSLYSSSEIKEQDEEQKNNIPDAVKGETVGIRELLCEDKKTSPPKRFTEATLLAAMNNIHKYVADPELKKVLKETLGIGTAATQAKIIETLISARNYISKEKRILISTDKGRALIDSVAQTLRKPDTTAKWEQRLAEIQEGACGIDKILQEITETVQTITSERKAESSEKRAATSYDKEEPAQPCPQCEHGNMRQLTGKFGKFWVCGSCGLSLSDDKGKPQKISQCPNCGKQNAVRTKGKNGYFWSCKSCKKTFKDKAGKLIT